MRVLAGGAATEHVAPGYCGNESKTRSRRGRERPSANASKFFPCANLICAPSTKSPARCWLQDYIQNNPANDKAQPNQPVVKSAFDQKSKEQKRNKSSDTNHHGHSAKHQTPTVVRITTQHSTVEPGATLHNRIRLKTIRQHRSCNGHRHRQKKKTPTRSVYCLLSRRFAFWTDPHNKC